MNQTMSYSATLEVVSCWCGMRHAVPEELRAIQERQHRDGEKVTAIYCPLGHTHIPAGKGEAQKLREQLETARKNADFWREQEAKERKSHVATKGQLTKARKRAQNGVCPCCNRSFVQLARHMASKHPGFEPESFT